MKYQYWLSNIKGIGNRTIGRLLKYVSTAEELYFLPKGQLMEIDGIDGQEAERIAGSRKGWDLETEYGKLEEKGISFFSREMETFPALLCNIPDPPYSIYVRGKLPDSRKKSVAIVGARMCSEYGKAVALRIGKRLAECQVQVISGMARGIDSYGHLGALDGGGETFAVLGCGVDVCYPVSNQDLYNRIMEKGGLISEYRPGQKPLSQLFPARNRLISGLSNTVVVVEAKERSGSLITADCALEQGRDVYAVPGRATDALSRGCNNLIRQGAGILNSTKDLLEDLGISDKEEISQEKIKNLLLEKDEGLVYSCLGLRPKNIEELSSQTGLSMQALADTLMGLLQKELIHETFKNYYIRNI